MGGGGESRHLSGYVHTPTFSRDIKASDDPSSTVDQPLLNIDVLGQHHLSSNLKDKLLLHRAQPIEVLLHGGRAVLSPEVLLLPRKGCKLLLVHLINVLSVREEFGGLDPMSLYFIGRSSSQLLSHLRRAPAQKGGGVRRGARWRAGLQVQYMSYLPHGTTLELRVYYRRVHAYIRRRVQLGQVGDICAYVCILIYICTSTYIGVWDS